MDLTSNPRPDHAPRYAPRPKGSPDRCRGTDRPIPVSPTNPGKGKTTLLNPSIGAPQPNRASHEVRQELQGGRSPQSRRKQAKDYARGPMGLTCPGHSLGPPPNGDILSMAWGTLTPSATDPSPNSAASLSESIHLQMMRQTDSPGRTGGAQRWRVGSRR